MSQDDEEIRLRDQIAIAAMQALLDEHQTFKTFIQSDKATYGEGKNIESKAEYFARIDKKTARLAMMAYRIADAMRKARLQSFG